MQPPDNVYVQQVIADISHTSVTQRLLAFPSKLSHLQMHKPDKLQPSAVLTNITQKHGL